MTLYRIITSESYYRDASELSCEGTLGPLMNIWTDANYRHEDQLLLGVL
jgi:hypothetical protein